MASCMGRELLQSEQPSDSTRQSMAWKRLRPPRAHKLGSDHQTPCDAFPVIR